MNPYRRRVLRLTCAAALVLADALPAPAQQSGASTKPTAQPAKQAKKPEAVKSAAVTPPAGNPKPSLLGQYEAWSAYTATPNGRKVCFAIARPASSQSDPPNRPRDPVFAFVSSRPAEKVKEEVSILIGYSFKSSSEASLAVGPAKFAMYTQNDSAWVRHAGDEPKVIDTLRKGSDMVIKGTSERGTQTSDTFSLKGISQALDRIAQECK
ncbi:MAG: invasion associated locus B family protein [Xanthobacteraceae bacterium]